MLYSLESIPRPLSSSEPGRASDAPWPEMASRTTNRIQERKPAAGMELVQLSSGRGLLQARSIRQLTSKAGLVTLGNVALDGIVKAE